MKNLFLIHKSEIKIKMILAQEQLARFGMQIVIFVQIAIKTAIDRDLPRFLRSQHHLSSPHHTSATLRDRLTVRVGRKSV